VTVWVFVWVWVWVWVWCRVGMCVLFQLKFSDAEFYLILV